MAPSEPARVGELEAYSPYRPQQEAEGGGAAPSSVLLGVPGAESFALPAPVGAALPRLSLPAATRRGLGRTVLDLAAIVLGVLVAVRGHWHTSVVTSVLLVAGYPLSVRWTLTRRATIWDDGSLTDELRQLVAATSVPALALIGADAVLGGVADVSLALRIWLFTLALLVVGRIVLHHLRASVPQAATRPTLIVGAGRVGADLARRLRQQPHHGLSPVGFLDYGPAPWHSRRGPRPPGSELPVLGEPDSLPTAIAQTGAECVAFAFTASSDERLLPLVEQCERLGVRAFVVPRMFEAVGWRTEMLQVGALPLGELRPLDPHDVRFAVKHVLDRVFAALLVLALAPLLLAVAALVKAGSDGPVLFRQRRIGRDGREFTMLKFRTMYERRGREDEFVPPEGCAPGGVELIDRRTPIGIWLRRTSIDELPQLFNVLRGEMSLIGPRPERPEYVRRFAAELRRYDRRHRVKSGITGLAQVSGLRGQTSIVERAAYDNFYVQNWSFWLDLKIALWTVATVLSLNGQ